MTPIIRWKEPRIWRIVDPINRVDDTAYARMRLAVCQRDQFRCACCGFVSEPETGESALQQPSLVRACGYMETHPRDDDHSNVDAASQVLYCVMCHAAAHLGLADATSATPSPGLVKLFPKHISQADVINLSRAYGVARYLGITADQANGIEEAWNDLYEVSDVLSSSNQQIGVTRFQAPLFSAWLMVSDDTIAKNFSRVADDLRFVPDLDYFGEVIAYWATRLSRRHPPEQWHEIYTPSHFRAARPAA